MTTATCPACHSAAVRVLDDISRDAWVTYFICESCRHAWNVPKPRPVATRRVGRMSYEGKFVIIPVPEGWKMTDPLPAPSPEDEWFTRQADFEAALNGPWDRKPIHRQPWRGAPAALPDEESQLR